MKVMGSGLPGGNSFMEDYTYHFEPGNELVLGSHMLEICPSIANNKPSCEIHPLGIGGKAMGKYEDVVAADPNNVLANIRIGSLYYASMNYPTAFEYLEKANALNPNFSIAHKELGELYLKGAVTGFALVPLLLLYGATGVLLEIGRAHV